MIPQNIMEVSFGHSSGQSVGDLFSWTIVARMDSQRSNLTNFTYSPSFQSMSNFIEYHISMHKWIQCFVAH